MTDPDSPIATAFACGSCGKRFPEWQAARTYPVMGVTVRICHACVEQEPE